MPPESGRRRCSRRHSFAQSFAGRTETLQSWARQILEENTPAGTSYCSFSPKKVKTGFIIIGNDLSLLVIWSRSQKCYNKSGYSRRWMDSKVPEISRHWINQSMVVLKFIFFTAIDPGTRKQEIENTYLWSIKMLDKNTRWKISNTTVILA